MGASTPQHGAQFSTCIIVRERVASSLFYRNSNDLQRLSTSSIFRRSRRSFLEKQLRHLTCPLQPVGRQAEDRLPDSRCQPVPGRDELSQRCVRAAIVQPAAPTLDASGMLRSNLRNMGHGCNSRRLHFLGRGSKPAPFRGGIRAIFLASMEKRAEKPGENRQKSEGKWRKMALFRGPKHHWLVGRDW